MNSNQFMEMMASQLGAAFFVIMVIYLAIIVLLLVSQWKIFVKAGQPGWAILVPFYNIYVYTQIIERPKWWMLLYFLAIIPLVGMLAVVVIAILDTIRLAKVFGKDGGFAVGLLLLGVVFYPILAFGDAEYQGTKADSPDLLDNYKK
jgi:hypothetical protein